MKVETLEFNNVQELIDFCDELGKTDNDEIDNDIEQCCICHTKIEWGSRDEQNGRIWYCEECMDSFCEKCFEEKHGVVNLDDMIISTSDEKILCPSCYGNRK